LLFIGLTHVAWGAAGLIAGGSIVGGQAGGAIGRRMSPQLLRFVIVAVGVAASVVLLA
jgi:uncharacterized membrane protein YfcA